MKGKSKVKHLVAQGLLPQGRCTSNPCTESLYFLHVTITGGEDINPWGLNLGYDLTIEHLAYPHVDSSFY